MVNTVRPNAKATPKKPIPSCGNAASRTAAPHPPKTSQNVPMNSAASFFDRGIVRFLSRSTSNHWAEKKRGTELYCWCVNSTECEDSRQGDGRKNICFGESETCEIVE